MRFKPYDRLLGSKDILQKCESNESTFRSVIHQSYYAAFNYLTSEIENRLFYPVDKELLRKSVHKAHFDACENKQNSLLKNHVDYNTLDVLVKDIKRLKGLRAKSDYELNISVKEGEAELSLLISERIFGLIDKLS